MASGPSGRALLARVVGAIGASGWEVKIETNRRPFRMTATKDGKSLRLAVYIWGATHGGGPRKEDEYRIQMTGVKPPLLVEAGRQTLLLGLSVLFDVITAWDPTYHLHFSPGSPSLQTSLQSMQRALASGFGFHRKTSNEVTVSFLPEFLMPYVEAQEQLHRIATVEVLNAVEVAAEEEIHEDTTGDAQGIQGLPEAVPPIEGLPHEDPQVSFVRRTIRQNGFARRVLRAYETTCCMCGMQLDIIEAAHIVPLQFSWNFSTRNGLALCPNHHKAFDWAILGVCDDYKIIINEERLHTLEQRERAGGAELILDCLNAEITVPQNPWDRPATNYLAHGRSARGID